MGEGNHVDHKVELAIAISFIAIGVAIAALFVFNWIRGEFFDDKPETNDTLDFSAMLGIPMWSAIVEAVRDRHQGLLGYLERYWVVGKHSAGKDHQAGAKQQDAKQGKMIRDWADSGHGQGVLPPTSKPTSHRKEK